MHVAVELSGEYETLPAAEAVAVASLDAPATVVHRFGRAVVLDTDTPPEMLADRLAMAWGAGAFRAVTEPAADAVAAVAEAVPIGGERFAVRARRLDTELPKRLTGEVPRRLGAALEACGGVVELDEPDVTVRVLLDERAVVASPWRTVDRAAYEDRHVRHRPFFMPITLHPRLARALVNLSGVRPGERLWDPFCGTGGILIEAGLVGARVVGSDLDGRMVDGTRAALDQQGVDHGEVFEADVADAPGTTGSVDAIVTDPPYGQASPTRKEAVGPIYERMFAAADATLRPGGVLVAMLPSRDHARAAPAGLRLEDVHEVPVHATLTRHVCRYVKATE